MSFSKNDLDLIKSKTNLVSEFEKKTKVIRKGKDYWCCCLFHDEKTPSCKINNDLGSYYCFGCGAKGDIFTIYTELYNFSFPDAVRELANMAGIKISTQNFEKNKEESKIYKILEISTKWFEQNLLHSQDCKNYLSKRSLSEETIKFFRIGYSYNPSTSLYLFLRKNNFDDKDILKTNLVKIDNNKKIRDFFYKRLIFPILNEQNKIVGFGGRVLDNSNPKYINSPESNFFKKRNLLFNLNNSKTNIRKKNNMLICEGYMDVISLHNKNIKTAVAPLGTALTENQLFLAWKYVNKPTIMFDGDNSGVRASYKSALMALQHLSPNKFLQFIKLPKDSDPDSLLNNYSIDQFINILKNPIQIVNFIFDEASSTIDLTNADNKISFDKFLDDLVNSIKDTKIKYFYKNEFKNLFFKKLKNQNNRNLYNPKNSNISLKDKQIYSFLTAYLVHDKLRKKIYDILNDSLLLDESKADFLNFFHHSKNSELKLKEIKNLNFPHKSYDVYKKTLEKGIFQLFPYTNSNYEEENVINDIQESIKNLQTRLSNLKKINKSLNKFDKDSSDLSWEELKKISSELTNLEEKK